MRFETETRFFNEHRREWIEEGHEGEWAAVHGTTLLGFFETAEDGYAAGVERFGTGGFLLKQDLAGRHGKNRGLQRWQGYLSAVPNDRW